MGKTPRITFRKLMPDDAATCAALDFRSFGEHDAWDRQDFFEAAINADFEFIVAERYRQIVGCAGAEIFIDGVAEIDSIAVDPNYQGQGIGKQLFIRLLKAVIKRGATFVVLEVRPSNTAAFKLYESMGFEIIDRVKNFYVDEDAWIMAREFKRGTFNERDLSSNDG
ncbi:MAG: ribosomal protein S18-alanine N-acetyltransferase [Selenomonadaceae bacterium]|nr:ribosomal protein S18-alanine N-acetyltransferase [Selenomonadaceae bacterium]